MKYIKYIILCCFIYSCETNVDVNDLLDQEQLIVINGYLSPQDTILKVQVSKSLSRATKNITESDLVIKNASVAISNENGKKVTLKYSEKSKKYEILANQLPILSGKKYFLTVNAQGKKFNASCQIPSSTIKDINFKLINNTSNYFQKIKVQFDDIENIKNYYILNGYFIDKDGSPWRGLTFKTKKFTTDNNRDGTKISVIGDVIAQIDNNQYVLIEVFNTEKVLFDTLKATYLNNENNGNIFYEPIISPSNIEGENGYGVFAGYQLTRVKKPLL